MVKYRMRSELAGCGAYIDLGTSGLSHSELGQILCIRRHRFEHSRI